MSRYLVTTRPEAPAKTNPYNSNGVYNQVSEITCPRPSVPTATFIENPKNRPSKTQPVIEANPRVTMPPKRKNAEERFVIKICASRVKKEPINGVPRILNELESTIERTRLAGAKSRVEAKITSGSEFRTSVRWRENALDIDNPTALAIESIS